MGRPAIPCVPKVCQQCNAQMERKRYRGTLESRLNYMRRRFCDQQCMAKWQEGRIKRPSAQNSRRQSAKVVRPACAWCQSSARRHVHHIDANPLNNTPANLLTLCAACHRLAHSPHFDVTTRQRKPCAYCEKPAQKAGCCWTHNTRRQRYGDPLMTKVKHGSSWRLERVGS